MLVSLNTQGQELGSALLIARLDIPAIILEILCCLLPACLPLGKLFHHMDMLIIITRQKLVTILEKKHVSGQKTDALIAVNKRMIAGQCFCV